MRAFCRGAFGEETKSLLKADDGMGIAHLSQPCAVCGERVVAENKAGEWVPKLHHKPAASRSGKDWMS
jgi:hypothetical protein